MSLHESYAVFGLGRYGSAVARELAARGADVIAVDRNPRLVDDMALDIPICKCADVTDADALAQLGISHVDVVIIAIAGSLETSVMAIMLCKEAGVKTVIAKCANETHRRILRKVGADKVVLPESESGIRMAKNLLGSGFLDILELSEDFSMVEVSVRGEWAGKTLRELDLRRKYAINIVAICRGDAVYTEIAPDTVLLPDMKLIIIADTAKLAKLK